MLAWVEDRELASRLEAPAVGPGGVLLRCQRCGTWVAPDDVAVGELLGTPEARVGLAALPLPARGSHGRKLALLRLLAAERILRGLAMVVAALAAYHVASDRASLLAWVERVVVAAQPLGEELGLHLTESPVVGWVERTLGGDGQPIQMAGLGLLVYGVLQVVEGGGLWGGWRWAEYLAVVATSLFVPLEVYELVEAPTLLKAAALGVNVTAVVYLVYKGRLFGVRGGHPAYVAEVRSSTLLGEVLDGLGRPAYELAGDRIV